MRIQSITGYYSSNISNYRNIKKTSNNVSFGMNLEDERAKTALSLHEARKALAKDEECLKKLKIKAVNQQHPDYDKIKSVQEETDFQRELVRNLEKKYKNLNGSKASFLSDVQIGRKLRKESKREDTSSPSHSDSGPVPNTINEIMGCSVGDWPFYSP